MSEISLEGLFELIKNQTRRIDELEAIVREQGDLIQQLGRGRVVSRKPVVVENDKPVDKEVSRPILTLDEEIDNPLHPLTRYDLGYCFQFIDGNSWMSVLRTCKFFALSMEDNQFFRYYRLMKRSIHCKEIVLPSLQFLQANIHRLKTNSTNPRSPYWVSKLLQRLDELKMNAVEENVLLFLMDHNYWECHIAVSSRFSLVRSRGEAAHQCFHSLSQREVRPDLDYAANAYAIRNQRETVGQLCTSHLEQKSNTSVIIAAVKANGKYLKNLEPEKQTMEIALQALKSNSASFNWVSDKFKADPRFIYQVLSRNGIMLKSVSEEYKDNKQMVIAAVSHSAKALVHASERLRNDTDVQRIVALKSPQSLETLPDSLTEDEVVDIINRSKVNLRPHKIPEKFRNSRKVLLARVKKTQIEPSEIDWTDCDIAIAAVIAGFSVPLQYIPKTIGNRDWIFRLLKDPLFKKNPSDRGLLDAIARQYSHDEEVMIYLFGEYSNYVNSTGLSKHIIEKIVWKYPAHFDKFREIHSDKEIILRLLDHKYANNHITSSLSSFMKDDKEIMLKAVQVDGFNLKYGSEIIKANVDVVRVAVEQNVLAFQFASLMLRDNKDLVLECIRRDKRAFKYASSRIQEDNEVIQAAGEQYARKHKPRQWTSKSKRR